MLPDEHRHILEFEAAHRRNVGGKEDLVRRAFGLSYPRYFQLLNRIIDDPDAMVEYPQEVKRLLRARARDKAQRASRRFLR